MRVQYDKLTTLKLEDLPIGTIVTVLFNDKNTNSVLSQLAVETLVDSETKILSRIEQYDSVKEFSTVAMKELLTLYAK